MKYSVPDNDFCDYIEISLRKQIYETHLKDLFLIRVEDDSGKYGFIDKTGRMVIPCKYNQADRFTDGLAKVEDDSGKYGFINKFGYTVIPCQYDGCRNLADDLIPVSTQFGKWGVIDKNGKQILPCSYDCIWDFHEGYAVVRNDQGKYIQTQDPFRRRASCSWPMCGLCQDDGLCRPPFVI